jgi:hypothetical protein
MPLFDEGTRQHLIDRLEKRRDRQRMEQVKGPEVYQLPGYTQDQLLEEAKRGTDVGNEVLFAEYQLMRELEKRRPR